MPEGGEIHYTNVGLELVNEMMRGTRAYPASAYSSVVVWIMVARLAGLVTATATSAPQHVAQLPTGQPKMEVVKRSSSLPATMTYICSRERLETACLLSCSFRLVGVGFIL